MSTKENNRVLSLKSILFDINALETPVESPIIIHLYLLVTTFAKEMIYMVKFFP